MYGILAMDGKPLIDNKLRGRRLFGWLNTAGEMLNAYLGTQGVRVMNPPP